ncbi:hypothetical protein CCY99_08120 [Helicobacter sp. 16-1353]|uniref:LolA-like outer membrane lipoprotein chaperone n=1 Tax=Helicobacter sp. 16-1353 TaxID=2004996 RepID=UPI000DCD0075|nr:LolA-like outer membrane lipoprotein chaperone [Helicobacter sp. 16-1353]RAX51915.1 hypothetical protein CCY99_08120 [Helicobacter sp. 16-1353]
MKYIITMLLLFNGLFALDLQNIKADFTQTISGEDSKITYSGNLIVTAESMALWKYKKPLEKYILINKNQITIFEPNLNQAIISKQNNIDFIKIINSMKESKDGLISEVNGQVFQIFLKDNKPYKIKYNDELDNKIEIMLENVEINQNIDKKVFNLNIPEDADVIFE